MPGVGLYDEWFENEAIIIFSECEFNKPICLFYESSDDFLHVILFNCYIL